jgi:hypothetical protein
MAGRQQATIEQQRAVEQFAALGDSAANIHRMLGSLGLYEYPNPDLSKRTIERMVSRISRDKLADASGPWSALDAPEQARLVLDVAAYVFDMSEGQVWITKDLAQWIARVRTVDPEIPPFFTFALARGYQSAKTNEESRKLDLELDAKPWKQLSEDESLPMGRWLATMDGWRDRNLRNLAFHGVTAEDSDKASDSDSKLTAESVDSSRRAQTDSREKRRTDASPG